MGELARVIVECALEKGGGAEGAVDVGEVLRRGGGSIDWTDAVYGEGGEEEQREEEEESAEEAASKGRIRLCVLGRTNVGKSTLINRLVGQDEEGEERLMVGPTPHLTRDSISLPLPPRPKPSSSSSPSHRELYNRVSEDELLLEKYRSQISLVDTAGLIATRLSPNVRTLKDTPDPSVRAEGEAYKASLAKKRMGRKSKADLSLREQIQMSSLSSMKRAHVVLFVLDGEALSLSRFERKLLHEVSRNKKPILVIANKADLLEGSLDEYKLGVQEQLREFFPQVPEIPVIAVSALRDSGVDKVLPAAIRLFERWSMKFGTGKLNRWLKDVMVSAPFPQKLQYVTQTGARPPTFTFFAGKRGQVPSSNSLRFLRSRLNESLGLGGVPIILKVKDKNKKGSNVHSSKTLN